MIVAVGAATIVPLAVGFVVGWVGWSFVLRRRRSRERWQLWDQFFGSSR